MAAGLQAVSGGRPGPHSVVHSGNRGQHVAIRLPGSLPGSHLPGVPLAFLVHDLVGNLKGEIYTCWDPAFVLNSRPLLPWLFLAYSVWPRVLKHF